MSKKKPGVHVTPHKNGGWKVQTDGAQRADSRHQTQADAIARGRDLAQTRGAELSIHGTNGQIRDKRSYGNNPCPPKDKSEAANTAATTSPKPRTAADDGRARG